MQYGRIFGLEYFPERHKVFRHNGLGNQTVKIDNDCAGRSMGIQGMGIRQPTRNQRHLRYVDIASDPVIVHFHGFLPNFLQLLEDTEGPMVFGDPLKVLFGQ